MLYLAAKVTTCTAEEWWKENAAFTLDWLAWHASIWPRVPARLLWRVCSLAMGLLRNGRRVSLAPHTANVVMMPFLCMIILIYTFELSHCHCLLFFTFSLLSQLILWICYMIWEFLFLYIFYCYVYCFSSLIYYLIVLTQFLLIILLCFHYLLFCPYFIVYIRSAWVTVLFLLHVLLLVITTLCLSFMILHFYIQFLPVYSTLSSCFIPNGWVNVHVRIDTWTCVNKFIKFDSNANFLLFSQSQSKSVKVSHFFFSSQSFSLSSQSFF